MMQGFLVPERTVVNAKGDPRRSRGTRAHAIAWVRYSESRDAVATGCRAALVLDGRDARHHTGHSAESFLVPEISAILNSCLLIRSFMVRMSSFVPRVWAPDSSAFPGTSRLPTATPRLLRLRT